MITAREALIDGTQRLRAAGIESARTDAELLLCHVLEVPRTRLMLVDTLDASQRMAFERLLAKRQARFPLQHLTGTAPFRYMELEIGVGALVPRPETEAVVESAIRWVRDNITERPLLLDLCSGAAPIALALATELDHVDVVGIEKFSEAQEWGRKNALRFAETIAARDNTLTLVDGDVCDTTLMQQYAQRASVVISNPPYIPDGMVPRDPEVALHDPKEALFGGPDGFAVIRELLNSAALALRAGGLLVIEHADAQGETAGDAGLPALVRAHGSFRDVVDHADLTNRPRYITALREVR